MITVPHEKILAVVNQVKRRRGVLSIVVVEEFTPTSYMHKRYRVMVRRGLKGRGETITDRAQVINPEYWVGWYMRGFGVPKERVFLRY